MWRLRLPGSEKETGGFMAKIDLDSLSIEELAALRDHATDKLFEKVAARVASFKATQQKFEREREEYYATTLGNAWSGFTRPPFWD